MLIALILTENMDSAKKLKTGGARQEANRSVASEVVAEVKSGGEMDISGTSASIKAVGDFRSADDLEARDSFFNSTLRELEVSRGLRLRFLSLGLRLRLDSRGLRLRDRESAVFLLEEEEEDSRYLSTGEAERLCRRFLGDG